MSQITKNDILGNPYYKIELIDQDFVVLVRHLSRVGLGFLAMGPTVEQAAEEAARRINIVRQSAMQASAKASQIPEANR